MESCLKGEGLSPAETTGSEIKKCCSDCKTSKTPLWRSGPTGPKSLCNACGIRYRKKRGPTTTKCDGKKGKTRNLMPLGQEVEVAAEGRRRRRRREAARRLKSPRQWGEVETAALLLMALSCGAVFG